MSGTERAEAPPPAMVLMQLLFGKQLTFSLSGLARLGVADHMDGMPRPVEEIAAKAGAHAPSLYRVMRMLASFGVFREEEPRHFALTPVGELLKSDAPGIACAISAMMFGDEFDHARLRAYRHRLRTGERRRDRGLWQADVGGARRTARAMRDVPERHDQSSGPWRKRSSRLTISPASNASPMSAAATALLLASILRRQSTMQGVLFDRPEVIASVPEDQFAGCDGRIAYRGGKLLRARA